jgi:hypothetical protein
MAKTATRLADLLREKKLLSRKSIPAWVVTIVGFIWRIVSWLSTADWAAGKLFASSRPKPDSPGQQAFHMSQGWISLLVFCVGIGWLTFIVAPWKKRSSDSISAKFLRCRWLPRDMWAPMTEQLMRAVNSGISQPTTQHFFMEIYLVNLGQAPITIQRVEAQIEAEGERISLKFSPSIMDKYLFSEQKDEEMKTLPFQTRIDRRLPLDDLWGKIKDVPLISNCGYRGWLSFEGLATFGALNGKIVKYQAWLIDSMDNRHPVLLKEPTSQEGEVHHKL